MISEISKRSSVFGEKIVAASRAVETSTNFQTNLYSKGASNIELNQFACLRPSQPRWCLLEILLERRMARVPVSGGQGKKAS